MHAYSFFIERLMFMLCTTYRWTLINILSVARQNAENSKLNPGPLPWRMVAVEPQYINGITNFNCVLTVSSKNPTPPLHLHYFNAVVCPSWPTQWSNINIILPLHPFFVSQDDHRSRTLPCLMNYSIWSRPAASIHVVTANFTWRWFWTGPYAHFFSLIFLYKTRFLIQVIF